MPNQPLLSGGRGEGGQTCKVCLGQLTGWLASSRLPPFVVGEEAWNIPGPEGLRRHLAFSFTRSASFERAAEPLREFSLTQMRNGAAILPVPRTL